MSSEAVLILASGSPRRKELLSNFNIPFQIIVPDTEENCVGKAREVVRVLALEKGKVVFDLHKEAYVLSADTLVSMDEVVMGKPQDAQEAKEMLARLSGKTHQVYTGIALHCPNGQVLCDVVKTDVTFDALSEKCIESYVAGGEPMDKAGAYGMQGKGSTFVTRINGSPSNVIGLPLHVVHRFFKEVGWIE